ncbi:Lysylphosphatidylglycerol synthetase/glycosyltransferase AglD [Gemmatirosa kalamazoonensis]|uniref:Lysylphosphatidylglycerol synthetase/glycosyltransferase AglD n=1 Tax=Gemmatirosa kalamazoonensis TaxID=861299 RepID=W0RE99_9BACT|nr:lysylphosphatidylglycerol synthase domain-containing protein [Gemmatirosa kalamazoonensis]AHG89141.1 Lysylphosphatidylglycerol synthetase/glycosyltransferase AglD [Gemmatirosa kalamazoonensis]
MSRTRWFITLISFAAALGASAFIVWRTWPEEGATVTLPPLAHLLGAGALVAEVLFRSWKIQLSAHALRIPLRFGAAVRVSLGGDFAASITPSRSGAEPARYLVLAESRVDPLGRLLILFTEILLEMFSLGIVAIALALTFRGMGTALAGLLALVGGYSALVIGVGALGLALSRRNAHGPPPPWAASIGLHAGRWRGVQRSLRQLRGSVDAVRRARLGAMTAALVMSVLHVVARMCVLPGLVFGAHTDMPLTLASLAPLVVWPLALQYGAGVAPAPGGGGVVEAAFGATLRHAIPGRIFGASLIWWRFYTFYAYLPLGALAAGRTVLRALRDRHERKHGRRHEIVATGEHRVPA